MVLCSSDACEKALFRDHVLILDQLSEVTNLL